MTDARPAPYPADTRAKGWRFEIDYEKVDQSDTWSLAAEVPMAQHALLMMWLVSWTQVPCGSFPNDEALVRAKCKVPPKTWATLREILMRGWWEAEDGRLYHDTIAEQVLTMLDTRGVDRTRQDARRNLFEKIRERDGRRCVYCGHTKYLTLDHVRPLSRGGDNDERNLVIACRPCNSKKRDRTPEEAAFTFIDAACASRWEAYKESAGEKRSDADESGELFGGDEESRSNSTGTGTGTTTSLREEEKPARKRAASPTCPDGVDAQTWTDFLDLRRKKAAPVTKTVLAGAGREAVKAGITLQAFLELWCLRGSQGLMADWLKPHEIAAYRRGAPAAPAATTPEVGQRAAAATQELLARQQMTPAEQAAADAARAAFLAKTKGLKAPEPEGQPQ